MKLGMNMLLWSTDVSGTEYDATFAMLKDAGFDGVEIPIFDREVDKYAELGARLDALGLEPIGARQGEQRCHKGRTHLRCGDDIFQDRQARPESKALERPGNAQPRQAVGRRPEQRLAPVGDPARIGPHKAADRVEEGRLAGPVGADDRNHLARTDLQRDPIERQDSAEADGEVRDLESWPRKLSHFPLPNERSIRTLCADAW